MVWHGWSTNNRGDACQKCVCVQSLYMCVCVVGYTCTQSKVRWLWAWEWSMDIQHGECSPLVLELLWSWQFLCLMRVFTDMWVTLCRLILYMTYFIYIFCNKIFRVMHWISILSMSKNPWLILKLCLFYCSARIYCETIWLMSRFKTWILRQFG